MAPPGAEPGLDPGLGPGAPAGAEAGPDEPAPGPDDELGLILACCHPALDPAVRVPLTLRSVCGLPTAEIAAAFLVPEATMAQRLVRAKRKIRQAGISLGLPPPAERAGRLGGVLRVVYLVFTAGHKPSAGDALVRGDLCDQAIRLARALAALVPDEAEVTGLLALLLLTDARRGARLSPAGDLVLLADQDRSRWDQAKIAEGAALLAQALRGRRPGPYQLQAAIAACHSCAPSAAGTDWAEIAALYGALLRYEPTPVIAANRAAAVAMAEGPAAGLALLDEAAADRQLARWPQLHIARAELLRRLGRRADAARAYQAALDLAPSGPRAGLHRPPHTRAGQLRPLTESATPAAVRGTVRLTFRLTVHLTVHVTTGDHGMSTITVRGATPADFPGIAKVAVATGQDEEWAGSDPAYLAYLLEHGTLLVAERDGSVTGFGATRLIGEGPAAISMLCDLFVYPGTHGRGCGRAILSQLWPGEPGRNGPRRMTFSSLHAHALPLYTRFGLDAWWPLLYLAGEVSALPAPQGWTVEHAPAAEVPVGGVVEAAGMAVGDVAAAGVVGDVAAADVAVAEVAAAEQRWTGVDRSADHRAWASRPHGQPVRAFRHGELAAAGTAAGHGDEYGLVHLAIAPGVPAADAVLAVLAALRAPDGRARVCLPGPHPAVRPLFAASWRHEDTDLFMASSSGLLDPHRAVPSPGGA